MVEVYQDAKGEWRFRVKGANGEIVAVSEGYTRKDDAKRGYYTMRSIVRDLTDVRELDA